MSYQYYDQLLQKLETLRPLESVSIQSVSTRLLIASIESNTYSVNVWCSYDKTTQVDQILRLQNVDMPRQTKSFDGSRSCVSFLMQDVERVASIVAEVANAMDLQVEPVHMKNYIVHVEVTNEN